MLLSFFIHTYVDDEPEEGPDYYYVLSGFSSLRVFAQLEMIGIKANALCKVLCLLSFVRTYVRTYVCMYCMYVRTVKPR